MFMLPVLSEAFCMVARRIWVEDFSAHWCTVDTVYARYLSSVKKSEYYTEKLWRCLMVQVPPESK